MAEDLRESGVAVGVFHPGIAETQMTRPYGVVAGAKPAWVSAETCAARLLPLFETLSLDTSGSFLDHNGHSVPW